MQPKITWLDDPAVFRVNQIEAHSDHMFYATEEAYGKGECDLSQSLNGTWQFYYSVNAKERPADFYKEEYDRSAFEEIAVPGHIELAGYDTLHYINTMYPWEAKIFRRPAYTEAAGGRMEGMFSEADYNPVGSYVCTFDLDENLRGSDRKIRIQFAGVEQAMYVWLNGSFVGYAEDTFTPSEFDLTPYVKEEGNLLAVEVHKRCSEAFLEDQDFFRFFGIFRDVTLFATPKVHVEDLWIRPAYDEKDLTGKTDVRVTLSENPDHPVKLSVSLLDEDKVLTEKEIIAEKQVMDFALTPEGAVTLWEYGQPKLYRLVLRVFDEEGELSEVIPWDFGFRKVEIRDRVMYLNQKRLIINGVNRHEWSAKTGRCISEKEEAWDMDCIKRNNMNAVRTCHYPNRLSWYNLCDREGIYMMAEVNLESHGSWQKALGVEASWNVPGSVPQWYPVVLDRAKTQFELLKNHTSILFWSLGNESFAGEGIAKMNAYYKEVDPSRLTHYEGVYHYPEMKAVISDVETRMYAPPAECREYLENNPPKPFILCEYMHDMGNSLGGLKSYMDLIDEFPQYQGGFIWDFIDQALYVEDEVTGEKVLRYGGDFDDRPSDYEFSGNGVVFANRAEKPAMQEVRYYYGLYK